LKKTIIALIICLFFFASGKKTEAMNHKAKEIPVTFEICLTYAICSFNFTEDRTVAKQMRFFHDKVVARFGALGNLSYVDECSSGISDFKAYIWQLTMERISQADELVLVGEKFRSSIQGTLLVDGQELRELVLELVTEVNQCQF